MTKQELKEMLEEQMKLLSERMKKEEDSRLLGDLSGHMREAIYAWARLFGDKDMLL